MKGRYILAHGCGQGGYTGLIDEVRLCGRALDAAGQQFPYVAGTVMIVR